MTRKELIERAERISGLPNKKNTDGAGALTWLAPRVGVHPTTIRRWAKKDNVPTWAVERIEHLERNLERETDEAAAS